MTDATSSHGHRNQQRKTRSGIAARSNENTTVVRALIEDLVERGLNLERRYLFVTDGAKALRAAIDRVFTQRVNQQRVDQLLEKVKRTLWVTKGK